MMRHMPMAAAAAALLLLAACGDPSAGRPSGSPQGTPEAEQTEELPDALPPEEQTRLLRRIDYALLGQGPYAGRALEGFWTGDADGDGTEELFVQCTGQLGRAVLFTFDPQEDGTPLCYYVADQSALGTSELLLDAANGVPLLSSSSGSGAGEFQQYSRWAGDRWAYWGGWARTVDWEATEDPAEPVVAESASLDGEEMTVDQLRGLMDRLGLRPLSARWEDLFTVFWPHTDLDALAAALEQHLEQAACDQILPARGDIDGDGEEELVWCVEGISNLWNENMSYDETFGAAEVEDLGLFSASRGSDLVIADPAGLGVEIRAGRLSRGAMEGLEIRDGLLCFTYGQGAVIRFRYAGPDPESGQALLEEHVPPEQQYLREGVWYAYSPFDTFAEEYRFSEFGSGTVIRRLTSGTGEYLQPGEGFRYTVSEDGRTVTITPTTGGQAATGYTYVPDSPYGPVLADLSNPSPSGSDQSKLWHYGAPPEGEALPGEHREKLPAAVTGGGG